MESRMKTLSKVFLLIVVLVVAGIYLKKDAPISDEVDSVMAAPAAIPVAKLLDDYAKNEVAANAMYKGEPISVRGEVLRVREDLFGNSVVEIGDRKKYPYTEVSCVMKYKESVLPLSVGDEVTIIGKCDGKIVVVELIDCRI